MLDELSEFDLARFPAARAGERSNPYVAFLIARQITLWHYQWLLVNEHLPQIAGQQVVNDVLQNGNRFYNPPPGDAFMPIEFGAAAYRFGHSMVRPSYRANFTAAPATASSPTADPFFALVFDARSAAEFSAPPSFDRDDLLGGYPAPRRYIGWQTFFDFGDGQVKNNKKIDTTISSVLFTLPVPAIAPHTQTSPTVLPQRNLLRQLTWCCPPARPSPRDGSHPAGRERSWRHRQPSTRHSRRAPHSGTTSSPRPRPSLTGSPRPARRADRHRDADRPAARRPHQLPQPIPRLPPFLGTDLQLGSNLNPNITGNRTYTRAHFLYYAGVVTPGIYR